jgi:hypothetical protein
VRRDAALRALWDQAVAALRRRHITPVDADAILAVLRQRIDAPLGEDRP